MKLNDTIAAIATPRGSGGIAIIRISGAQAVETASKIVFPLNNRPLCECEDRKLTLCKIQDPSDGGYMIDRTLAVVMRAPRTYTGEDVVEINCHGGYLAADKTLDALLKCGARLAEAGEFTRRAFINGKTDLCGAEAVMDLMDATSESGLNNAAKALGGGIAKKINEIRDRVLALASHISAAADYPEEVDPPEPDESMNELLTIHKELKELADGFETGRIMRDGVRTAIVGKPNVGKSSILNALLKFERAIVTDVPGTTRDTIEELISIGGIALRLIDTAGIRDASDEVEKIGIERSQKNIELADLVLFVIDVSSEITDEDIKIAKSIRDKKCILILNKKDKGAVFDTGSAAKPVGLSPEATVETSAPKGAAADGIDRLEEIISDMFAHGKVKSDEVYLANERQKDAVLRAAAAIEHAMDGIENNMPYDLSFVDMEDAMSALGEITGETVQEEIVDKVFERFCVGK